MPGRDQQSDLRPPGAEAGASASFVVGKYGILEDADEVACDLVGYERSELVGSHGMMLIPPERHVQTALSIDRMRHGDIDFREGVLQHKDGTLVEVEVRSEIRPDGRLLLKVRRRSTS